MKPKESIVRKIALILCMMCIFKKLRLVCFYFEQFFFHFGYSVFSEKPFNEAEIFFQSHFQVLRNEVICRQHLKK